jgi:hypothetical protein
MSMIIWEKHLCKMVIMILTIHTYDRFTKYFIGYLYFWHLNDLKSFVGLWSPAHTSVRSDPTHLLISVYVDICMHMNICMYVYMYIHIYVYIFSIYIYAYLYIFIYIHVHELVSLYIYTHKHTYMHIHTSINAYIHTCNSSLFCAAFIIWYDCGLSSSPPLDRASNRDRNFSTVNMYICLLPYACVSRYICV